MLHQIFELFENISGIFIAYFLFIHLLFLTLLLTVFRESCNNIVEVKKRIAKRIKRIDS